MAQTKKGSLIESLANIVIGFSINFVANLVILPAYGFSSLTAKTNFIIGLWYTVISVARSYFLRRLFNKIKAKWNKVQNERNVRDEKEVSSGTIGPRVEST